MSDSDEQPPGPPPSPVERTHNDGVMADCPSEKKGKVTCLIIIDLIIINLIID